LVQDRKGALFFVITNESIDTLMSVVMIFHSERMIFIKEHSAGACRHKSTINNTGPWR
jgi:hypothetical protein